MEMACDLPVASVEYIQLAVRFVDDAVFVIGAGPADIPLGAVGQLVGLFGLRIVGIEIQRVVFVGRIINLVADPHGITVAARIVGDFFRGVRLQIEDVELLSPAAGIALPGAEIAEQRRVDNLRAVGRIIARAGFGHGERLRKAAVR